MSLDSLDIKPVVDTLVLHGGSLTASENGLLAAATIIFVIGVVAIVSLIGWGLYSIFSK